MGQGKKSGNTISIAGVDVPVHLAWKKIEALNTGADLLERLNEKYPGLSTDFTAEIVPVVRNRMKSSVGQIGAPPKVDDDFLNFLKEEIHNDNPLDLLDRAKAEKGKDISIDDLLYFVGKDAYMDAMHRQAREFHDNRISHAQICQLWNESELPAPGKDLWKPEDIEAMIGPEEFTVS